MKTTRILNLGAGVQSTTLALMGVKNWQYKHAARFDLTAQLKDLPYPMVGLIDLALFADTQGEPKAVYRHLEWLKPICAPWFPVKVISRGSLSEALLKGLSASGHPFISIPAFTTNDTGRPQGIKQRQCTREYKTQIIEQYVRREVLGLKPGYPAPRENGITQLLGLSYDETARVIRVKARFHGMAWGVEFPLWLMEMTRGGCKTWLKKHYPNQTIPRSACVYCPYHTNAEWRTIKDNPEDWAEAVRIDEAIRRHDDKLFVHSSCVPLSEADLREPDEKTGQQQFGFLNECEGMCGV